MNCKSYIILGVFIAFYSCKGKPSDNNYKYFNYGVYDWKSKQVTQYYDAISYKATEVPLEYYLLKQIGNDSKLVDSISKENSRERIVEFQFQHQDQKDLLLQEFTNKSYEDAVKYMAFTIEKDFKVVTETNDTISCSGVHFERNFKVAPYKKLLLYFNHIDQKDNIKLIYNDQLFGNGLINFSFKETPIEL